MYNKNKSVKSGNFQTLPFFIVKLYLIKGRENCSTLLLLSSVLSHYISFSTETSAAPTRLRRFCVQHCHQRHTEITAVLNEVSSTPELAPHQSQLAQKPSEYFLENQRRSHKPADFAQMRVRSFFWKVFVLPKHTNTVSSCTTRGVEGKGWRHASIINFSGNKHKSAILRWITTSFIEAYIFISI